MKVIGSVEGGVDTVLDAFMEHLSDGLLISPTHTWQEWNNKDHLFNPETEPSCVGILSEPFRKRKGVIRSWHSTHSVAAMFWNWTRLTISNCYFPVKVGF